MKPHSIVCNRCHLVCVKFYLNRCRFTVVIEKCLGGSLFWDTLYTWYGTTTITTILLPFVQDNPEETYTHSHLSWSSTILYQLHLLASPLFNFHADSLFAQPLSKSSLVYLLGLEPSTSCSIHFFIQSLSFFCSRCPYHRNLFFCSTKIMSVIYS